MLCESGSSFEQTWPNKGFHFKAAWSLMASTCDGPESKHPLQALGRFLPRWKLVNKLYNAKLCIQTYSLQTSVHYKANSWYSLRVPLTQIPTTQKNPSFECGGAMNLRWLKLVWAHPISCYSHSTMPHDCRQSSKDSQFLWGQTSSLTTHWKNA